MNDWKACKAVQSGGLLRRECSNNMATAVTAAGLFLNLILAFCPSFAYGAEDNQFPLLMPKAKPVNEEAYICTPIRLSDTETFYVTKFTPNASAHTAHHMLVSYLIVKYYFRC